MGLLYYTTAIYSIEPNNVLIKLFLLITFCILCVLWPSNKLLSTIKTTYKVLLLLLFILLGLCIALDARDLMLLYIGVELASIPIYILVSNKEYMISIEAGIKYYTLGAMSSFFFLLGITMIYGLTGSTLYDVLHIYDYMYSI